MTSWSSARPSSRWRACLQSVNSSWSDRANFGKDPASSESGLAGRDYQRECHAMPSQPGPPAGGHAPPEPHHSLSVDLRGEHDEWPGSLDVYWFELDRVWCGQVTNSHRKLIQDGRDLQMAGEQSHEQAMKVLLQFLLAAADKPVSMFHDATTVWPS